MSYVEKDGDNKKLQENEKPQLENPFKVILKNDTAVELPEDIIDGDTDLSRKMAFKKAYENIQLIEAKMVTKKRKKAQKDNEKQQIRQQVENTRVVKREKKERNNEGRERDD